MTDWHRLFGMALTDLFTNTKYQVELEQDLSIQPQHDPGVQSVALPTVDARTRWLGDFGQAQLVDL
jgi:hypothetical protein